MSAKSCLTFAWSALCNTRRASSSRFSLAHCSAERARSSRVMTFSCPNARSGLASKQATRQNFFTNEEYRNPPPPQWTVNRPKSSPKKRIQTAKYAEYAEKWNSSAYFAYSAVLPSLPSCACTGSPLISAFQHFRISVFLLPSSLFPLPSPVPLRQHPPLLVRFPRNRLALPQAKRHSGQRLTPPDRLADDPANSTLARVAELGKNPV